MNGMSREDLGPSRGLDDRPLTRADHPKTVMLSRGATLILARGRMKRDGASVALQRGIRKPRRLVRQRNPRRAEKPDRSSCAERQIRNTSTNERSSIGHGDEYRASVAMICDPHACAAR